MSYEVGVNLMDRESGEIFTVVSSNEILTQYCNEKVRGRCITQKVVEIFEIKG